MPPKSDELLTKTAVNILLFAPIFGLTFGYWTLGNPAMFLNDKKVLLNQLATVNPHHYVLDFSKQSYPALMMLCFLVFYILL